jgi:hypothetical protein
MLQIPISDIKNTKFIEKIHDLSGNKLIKVLELGLIAYDGCENQSLRWDNSEFNKKIEAIQNESTEKLQQQKNKYEKSLNDKESLINSINENNKNSKTQLFNELKCSLELQYREKINFKTKQYDDLACEHGRLKEKTETNLTTWTNTERERISALNDYHKKEMKEEREKYEKKIDKLNNIVQSIHLIQENSSLKGQVGENMMFKILTMFYPKFTVEDTHKEPNRGDFIIDTVNDKKILIDNKDYKGNIPKKEIDKFISDIENNADVHGGALLSNCSGIAKRGDFEIEIISGKPVIYLYNTNDNKQKIKSAIDLLLSIINTEHIDFSDPEIHTKIKGYSSEIKRKISQTRRYLKKHEENMLSSILDIENSFKSLLLTTKVKY